MAINDFLTFAGDPAANVMPQANYAAGGFTARLLGFSSGTALSVELNKVWRQASVMSHMLGKFTIEASGQDALDDGTPAGINALQSHFTNAVKNTALSVIGVGYLPLSGGSLSGNLSVNGGTIGINGPAGSHAAVVLNKPAGLASLYIGTTNSVMRWQMQMPSTDPEQGGNSGSNFYLQTFHDNGAYLDTPIQINRASSVVSFSRTPVVNGGPLPYVALSGGQMWGTLGIGGTGVWFPSLGGNWANHRIALGWDNAFMIGAVDGTYIGQLATVGWTQANLGNYLPLWGGVINGQLNVNYNLYVFGSSGFAGTTYHAGLGDFAHFYGQDRYRYRQWANNWYDYWDGANGYRGWVCSTNGSMGLDGGANLWLSGTVKSGGGRIVSQTAYGAAVCAWSHSEGVATGFWTNWQGMWLGNMDGSGNPTNGHVLVDNNGYTTVHGGMTISSNLSVSGGIWTANSVTCHGQIDCYGNAIWTKGGYPQVVAYNNNGTMGGFVVTHNRLELAFFNSDHGMNMPLLFLDRGGAIFGVPLYGQSGPRLKTGIVAAAPFDSLSAIASTTIRAYQWALEGGRKVMHGLVTTDLLKTLPDTVVDGEEMGECVDIMSLIAHLFRAVSQLEAKVAALAKGGA